MTPSQHIDLFRQSTQEEHAALRRSLDTLCAVADAIGEIPLSVLQQQIQETQRFLSHQFFPMRRQKIGSFTRCSRRCLGRWKGSRR